MCVGQANGYYLVSHTYHKGIVQPICQMKLFQGNFAAFLYFRFIFAVLCVLYLVGCACAACFKLHLNTQVPMLVELVVSCQHKARNRDGVALEVAIPLGSTVKAVDAVVLELAQYLAITANAIAIVTVHLS